MPGGEILRKSLKVNTFKPFGDAAGASPDGHHACGMVRTMKKTMRIASAAAVLAAAVILGSGAAMAEEARPLDVTIKNSNGKETGVLLDEKFSTRISYEAGDTITVTAEEDIAAFYVVWGDEPTAWTLTTDTGGDISCEGKYLHEFIPLATPAKECVVNIPEDMHVCDVKAYSAGDVPADMQLWEPPCEKADILVFATHADDEILFMGGILADYGGQQGLGVQVVYLNQYWEGTNENPIREHEKLDGLWTSGIKNYPVCMGYPDEYSKDLETAKSQVDYDKLVGEIRTLINTYEPLVVVTQDENGEYGHGQHMLLSAAVRDAVDNPEAGDWDVPKTYLHLWGENKITLDLRQPLSNFGGKTAFEVAEAAYLKHRTQQRTAFVVSDDNEYSMAEFGLYRTLVGTDTGNDLMEHVVGYRSQSAEETDTEPENSSETAEVATASSGKYDNELKHEHKTEDNSPGFFVKFLISLAIVSAIAAVIYVVRRVRNAKEEKRLAELRAKMQAERRALERRREERRASSGRNGERRTGERRSGERRRSDRSGEGVEAGDRRTGERRRPDAEGADGRSTERRNGDRRTADRRVSERRNADRRSAERRDSDRRNTDRRQYDGGEYRRPVYRPQPGRRPDGAQAERHQYNFRLDNSNRGGDSGNNNS